MVDQYGSYGDEVNEESILNAATGDQPSLDDLLGFSPYVEAIKEFLINPSTKPPLTLSLEGPWGSGKSSFMLQLKKKLEDDGEYTVLFNAWRHDKEDTMWAAFALEFIRQLSRDLTLSQRLKTEYKLLRSRIRWANKRENILQIIALFVFLILYLVFFYLKGFNWINLLPIQFMILSYLGASYAFYKVISSFVLDLKNFLGNSVYSNLKKCIKTPDYENRTTFIEEFHEDFKNIVECYAEGKKVFVFIDDLDRCEVPKAADLMQALNLMISNDPHLIFIVGMDRLKVASGLAVKYERLIPYLNENKKISEKEYGKIDPYNGLEYGYEFLEKFIQLPFSVPNPNRLSLSNLNELVDTKKARSTELKPNRFWNKVSASFKKISSPETALLVNLEHTQEEHDSTLSDANDQSETKSQERQRKFIEKIRIQVTSSDSQIFRDIILMVSPTLEYNPRRIKQFINLFRLKTFIASETGLFCVFEDSSYKGELTLEKLGKFVAITLKWPLIVSDLGKNENLFDELQKFALDTLHSDELTHEAKRWTDEPKLIELLSYGCIDESDGSVNPQGEKKYGLAGLNMHKLLQVSPKLVRPEKIVKEDFEAVEGTQTGILSSSKIFEEENHTQQIDIRKMLEDLKEKDKLTCQESKGTNIEEIACAVNREVQKWEIGTQDEMSWYVSNMVLLLKSKIPRNPENKKIVDMLESMKYEKDLVKQYKMMSTIIGLIPTINVVPEEVITETLENLKNSTKINMENDKKPDDDLIYMEPQMHEELVLHIGSITSGGVEHTLTIPLQEISYAEINADLNKIKGKNINKLSQLPESLARKVKGYLLLNGKEDIVELLT